MKSRVIFGDCRDTMRELIAQGVKVQTCVTSPPYWGLRDYGHPGQLGLEPTPAAYVANMVEVFRLVRDLMADDGTLWLNLGDSYAATGKSGGGDQGKRWEEAGADHVGPRGGKWRPAPDGLKPKDLVGIPWRVAFALQADGWYLRSGIIWHKPNPMPESVTDRPTKAHEYIFLLSKSERYYYDADAIKEPSGGWNGSRFDDPRDLAIRPTTGRRSGNKARKPSSARGCPEGTRKNQCGSVPWEGESRNKRTVWTVSTKPYAGAHFATYPPELIEPCILAGSRPGDIVFDPFFGSGTTGQVAEKLGRLWIGAELNPQYGDLQKERTAQQGLVI